MYNNIHMYIALYNIYYVVIYIDLTLTSLKARDMSIMSVSTSYMMVL